MIAGSRDTFERINLVRRPLQTPDRQLQLGVVEIVEDLGRHHTTSISTRAEFIGRQRPSLTTPCPPPRAAFLPVPAATRSSRINVNLNKFSKKLARSLITTEITLWLHRLLKKKGNFIWIVRAAPLGNNATLRSNCERQLLEPLIE